MSARNEKRNNGREAGEKAPEGMMEEINRYTRRALEPEEVFAFPVILCDNEVDRDWERFTDESLEELGRLFVGKTGVFDHSGKAEHQSARIFRTRVEGDGDRANSLGEPYRRLRAWAYTVRTAGNADLILEIEGGIKKEVSVGCAVEEALCSICGKDRRKDSCSHVKGRKYGGKLCHHLLAGPTDAYEWSFVAVPAQREAGVTKQLGEVRERLPKAWAGGGLQKLLAGGEDLLLEKEKLGALSREYGELRALAEEGKQRRAELRREVVKLALLAQPDLEAGLARRMAEGLDPEELAELRKSLARAAGKRYPLALQLVPRTGGEEDPGSFRV